jgi:hypothetical protein
MHRDMFSLSLQLTFVDSPFRVSSWITPCRGRQDICLFRAPGCRAWLFLKLHPTCQNSVRFSGEQKVMINQWIWRGLPGYHGLPFNVFAHIISWYLMSLLGMLKWELRDWRPLARELDPDDPVPMFGSVFRGHSAVMDSHGTSRSHTVTPSPRDTWVVCVEELCECFTWEDLGGFGRKPEVMERIYQWSGNGIYRMAKRA